MKIKYLFKEDISKFLDFNDETGKFEKEIEDYRIEINSWNGKIFIKKKDEEKTIDIPEELIKLLINIDDKLTIEFKEVSRNL